MRIDWLPNLALKLRLLVNRKLRSPWALSSLHRQAYILSSGRKWRTGWNSRILTSVPIEGQIYFSPSIYCTVICPILTPRSTFSMCSECTNPHFNFFEWLYRDTVICPHFRLRGRPMGLLVLGFVSTGTGCTVAPKLPMWYLIRCLCTLLDTVIIAALKHALEDLEYWGCIWSLA